MRQSDKSFHCRQRRTLWKSLNLKNIQKYTIDSLCSDAIETMFDSLRQTHDFLLWTPPPSELLCHYPVDMYHKGDGCSHSSSQYQRWGWYSTFNTALIAWQSHSKGKQLCSECTRMCDCKLGNTRRANLSLWTMVENVSLFGQVVLKHWPWCLLPSQNQTLEDWKNKWKQNENYVVISQGISADCTMI